MNDYTDLMTWLSAEAEEVLQIVDQPVTDRQQEYMVQYKLLTILYTLFWGERVDVVDVCFCEICVSLAGDAQHKVILYYSPQVCYCCRCENGLMDSSYCHLKQLSDVNLC